MPNAQKTLPPGKGAEAVKIPDGGSELRELPVRRHQRAVQIAGTGLLIIDREERTVGEFDRRRVAEVGVGAVVAQYPVERPRPTAVAAEGDALPGIVTAPAVGHDDRPRRVEQQRGRRTGDEKLRNSPRSSSVFGTREKDLKSQIVTDRPEQPAIRQFQHMRFDVSALLRSGDHTETLPRHPLVPAGDRGDFADPAASLASAESTFAEFPTAIITLKRNSGEGNVFFSVTALISRQSVSCHIILQKSLLLVILTGHSKNVFMDVLILRVLHGVQVEAHTDRLIFRHMHLNSHNSSNTS